tara:strand:- start:887 stop:1105 length:219 start_codon:yes stop_codon:yes gene_type:complete
MKYDKAFKKHDKTLKLIEWYFETNPSLNDLENEIEYHKIDISTNDFINTAEYLKVFLNSEVKIGDTKNAILT